MIIVEVEFHYQKNKRIVPILLKNCEVGAIWEIRRQIRRSHSFALTTAIGQFPTLSCLMKIIIGVQLCTFALFHICIFICVFFVFILSFCVEFEVTPFILLYIFYYYYFFFFFIFYKYFLVFIIIINNFIYFCITNSKPKTSFENGIGMYIPKRQNKEYEPKTCDFLLALLNHPEDITFWNQATLEKIWKKNKLKLTTLIAHQWNLHQQ